MVLPLTDGNDTAVAEKSSVDTDAAVVVRWSTPLDSI